MGKELELHGLPVYTTGDGATVIVIITDPFGWNHPDARFLADNLARSTSATVWLPDFFSGDSLPAEQLSLLTPPSGELSFFEKSASVLKRSQAFAPWLFAHREGVSWPIIERFFGAAYNEKPTRTLIAAGYGWGGRYAALLTHREKWTTLSGTYKEGGFIHSAFVAHPILMTPDEVEKCERPITMVLGDAEEVGAFKKLQAAAQKKGIRCELLEGAQQGFALHQGKSAMEKRYWEKSRDLAVEWAREYL
ncbi:hypothetical protein BZA77DRAFT_173385 [Pyronema omphalodes]|nr:hypothetical protein BZA77DRAFT_173385 [Pyronema omphalodes]